MGKSNEYIKLFHRYSKLDKVHQYQVVNDLSIYTQWVWFYLGRFIPKNAGYHIYPYEISLQVLSSSPKNKLLKKYRDKGSAKKIAFFIAKAIEKHYKEAK